MAGAAKRNPGTGLTRFQEQIVRLVQASPGGEAPWLDVLMALEEVQGNRAKGNIYANNFATAVATLEACGYLISCWPDGQEPRKGVDIKHIRRKLRNRGTLRCLKTVDGVWIEEVQHNKLPPSGGKYAILMRQRRLFGNKKLPQICLEVFQSLDGSSDPLPPAIVERAISLLEDVLREWEEPCKARKDFDEAVRAMVEATVAMAKSLAGARRGLDGPPV